MGKKIIIELPDDDIPMLTFGALRAIELINWSISHNGLEHTLEKIREIGQELSKALPEDQREGLFDGMLRHVKQLKEGG